MTAAAWLMLTGALIALGTLAMTLRNLSRYRAAPAVASPEGSPLVSICIPARNEEANLGSCVGSLLASEYARIEVLVYDDDSTDGTARILAALTARDARVRDIQPAPLPEGWNGKQHACWRMAQAGRGRWLLFTDADVRFTPDAVGRSVALAERGDLGLLSTFPRQVTGTLGEALLVPMIHFILMSYLPLGRMRGTNDPAASAGCGQFLLARRDAYDASGGHAAFRDSMHDGIKMPRMVRRAGFRTDLFDGTDLASCRMYHGLAATWRGFAKNAFEGLGSIGLLVLLTVLHGVGHVLPWAYLGWSVTLAGGEADTAAMVLAGVAVVLALAQRTALAHRFGQSPVSVVLHPVGVTLMTLIQWHSFAIDAAGQRSWRGRTLARSSAGAGAANPAEATPR